MAKLKEVLGSEVHWQLDPWHTKDQAYTRLRMLLGDDVRYFAPVYVTHGSFYWSDPEPDGWRMLTDATSAERQDIMATLGRLRSRAEQQYPREATRIGYIFTWPNDDYVFFRRSPGGDIDVRVTGWGFANFHRAYGGGIQEDPVDDKRREVRCSFSIDGIKQPARAFKYLQGTAWADQTTDAEGFFSFGILAPGVTLRLVDAPTGKDSTVTVDEDTHDVDIDVTEYLTVRVQARHDDRPVDGEDAHLVYGHRTASMTLRNGVAECQLPWLEGKECRVELRGESQSRQLDKAQVNVFTFEFLTPPPEIVPEPEPAVEFNASVLVVDQDNNSVRDYPINIDLGQGAQPFLTDDYGRIDIGRVVSGNTMIVADGNNPSYNCTYTLDSNRPEYVFTLPFSSVPADGDCVLRVIEKDKRPSAGTTCILSQDDTRVMAHLDEKGEMLFDSADFKPDRKINVGLYSRRRPFPPLSFDFDETEKEYELVEVDGPTPWWKVALEILSVVGAGVGILALSAVAYGIYRHLPLFFA